MRAGVSRVVGPERARQFSALSPTAAHGITDLELSGHLTREKWHAGAEDLVELLVGPLTRPAREQPGPP